MFSPRRDTTLCSIFTRATMCDSLESAEFTSVKQRIDQIKQFSVSEQMTVKLVEFIGSQNQKTGIPFSFSKGHINYSLSLRAGSLNLLIAKDPNDF